MDVRKRTIEEYTDLFASREPVPGGGGVSSVIGALAAAAGEMVCSLTVGKKKFESIEPEINGIARRLNEARHKMLTLSDRDAEVFEPLAAAYKDPTRPDAEMDVLYANAAQIPLDVMRCVFTILDEIDYLADNGSRLAVSDAACAAVYARAALSGEILNIRINTRFIKNIEIKNEINNEADNIYNAGIKKCDMIFDKVMKGME